MTFIIQAVKYITAARAQSGYTKAILSTGGFPMNQCDYLLFLKQLPMFNEVPLSIVETLLKNGTFIRGSSDQSPSFLHSQSVYIVLKGNIRFTDSRLLKGRKPLRCGKKAMCFRLMKKAGSLYRLLSQSMPHRISWYSIFHIPYLSK